MKKLIFFIMLISAPLAADELIEQNLPIHCGPTQNLLEGLNNKYHAEVLFMASDKNDAGHDIFHSLWLNQEKTTWTLLVVNKQMEMSCIIASGANGRMLQSIGI